MRPTVKLWELYDITSSKRVFEKDWKKSWVPFYRAREIVKLSENWYVDNELFISEEMYKEYWEKYWLPKKNDIMVTWVGTIWICYLVKDNDKFYIKDGNILRFKNKWKDVNSRFVEYFFKTDLLKNQIQSFWSVVQTLTIQKAKEVEIPLPPLETQKAIVAKLDQIFAELDQTKSEIQKNLDNTDELWKSALNQAFQGDWEMKTLQDVCLQKITDWTHQTPTYCGEKEWIPFISSKDVTKEYIDREWWIKYIPQSLHEELYARIAPQKDDVLLAKNWTTWVAAIVEDDRIFDIYVTLAVLRPNQKIITPRFLHRIVNSPICKRQFDKSLKWAGVPNLHLENIKTVTIPVPPLSEQEKIVEHLDQVSKEVKALKSQYQSQLDNLEELKKSVLDKAFRWELGE